MLMDEGVCSTHRQSRPFRLSVARAAVQKSMPFADNKFFRQLAFFVSTEDKEAVTSCRFAMQAVEVCVYTSVKFDLCSLFASVRTSGRLLMVAEHRWLTLACVGRHSDSAL